MISSPCGAIARPTGRLPKHSRATSRPKAAFASRREPRNFQNASCARPGPQKRARNCFHFLPFFAANDDLSTGYRRLSGKNYRPTPSVAPGQIPPSRTKARPSQTKKMGLDSFGFLRPIRGISTGYEQSKSRNRLPCQVRRRPAAMKFVSDAGLPHGRVGSYDKYSPPPAGRPQRAAPRSVASGAKRNGFDGTE